MIIHSSRVSPVLAILTLCMVGCAGIQLADGVKTPTFTVRGVTVEVVPLGPITASLEMDAYNPNGFDLATRAIHWTLSIGRARAASGQMHLEQTLPAQATAPVVASLALDADNAIGVARELATGTRDYTISGTVTAATRFGDISIPFEHRGTLPSPRSLLPALGL